jgi:predicted TIM-barrel fold metal-dependent hydrolase
MLYSACSSAVNQEGSMFEKQLPYPVWDADNHLFDNGDQWRDYLDQATRGSLPEFDSVNNPIVPQSVSRSAAAQLARAQEDGREEPPPSMLPGSSLNRLNPYKNLTPADREKVVEMFKELAPAYQDRDRRLEVMDLQGVEGALMFPQGNGLILHDAFPDDAKTTMACVQAFNRWVDDKWGFSYKNRIFVPAVISLMDMDLALKEVDWALAHGARSFLLPPGPLNGRSPADPIYDPFWARINEAKIGVTIHLNYTHYQKRISELYSEDPSVHFLSQKGLTAFQWFTSWGDRPAMDTVASMTFHGLFNRFPDVRVALSEQGTVWVAYTVRKMDHAFLMGRKGTFGDLTERPSETFRKHFLVAPYPEEIVERPVEAVGTGCLTFGSDFPHGEGLADPAVYVDEQLKGFDPDTQRKIMADNLREFLVPAA